eukprot:GHVR01048117.1.p1 GENE.GHVR01048117.1~~GHVR01048117.1.p1  ORF type:complete len:387 (+),score=78.80 GHVR01048117.1:36-1196(+)
MLSRRCLGVLRKTALYDIHTGKGGQMVEFAGHLLPQSYRGLGHIDSHLHTRSKASLFDVSHMGQLRLHGKDRVEFLESLCVGDIVSLQPGDLRLTLLTNETGGIIDDCVVASQPDYLGLVINGACAEKDTEHIKTHLSSYKWKNKDVTLEVLEDYSLIALQGPHAMSVIERVVPSTVTLSKIRFMTSIQTNILGVNGTLSRCGYTGEDGFELSVPNTSAPSVFECLLEDENVRVAGLSCRDSLRVEAGLCLYGHDIDENTNPVEARLTWTIGKRRKKEGGFLGHKYIQESIKNKDGKRRCGLLVEGRPAREGAPVFNKSQTIDETPVGRVTSGTFSPSLGRPIAMAYLPFSLSKIGSVVNCGVGSKLYPAVVTNIPFIACNYWKCS